MGSLLQLTKRQYGKWEVIKRVESNDHGESQWLCRCVCGVERNVRTRYLLNGKSKSCGCSKKLLYGESAFNNYYSSQVKGAAKRTLIWELSKAKVREITSSNCHYCDAIPSQIKKTNGNNGHYIANGIDRIDNDRGYLIDNVVPCCRPCNIAKGIMTYSQFKALIAKIYHNLKLH